MAVIRTLVPDFIDTAAPLRQELGAP
jgi:hypothetical protein